jgi:hypothetical protein
LGLVLAGIGGAVFWQRSPTREPSRASVPAVSPKPAAATDPPPPAPHTVVEQPIVLTPARPPVKRTHIHHRSVDLDAPLPPK